MRIRFWKRKPREPTIALFAGGALRTCSEDQLREVFSRFGAVRSLQSTFDASGQMRFAIVEMPEHAAQLALQDPDFPGNVPEEITICPAPPDRSILKSETFMSFLEYIGDRPYVASEDMFEQLRALAADEIKWITRLDEENNAKYAAPEVTRLFKDNRVLTMGPLEGAQEWHIARQGAAEVVSIEGYHPNLMKCQLLNTVFTDLPLRFVESEILQADLQPGFQVVICNGILYHLREPHRLVAMIRDLDPQWTLLSTQLAMPLDHPASARHALQDESYVEYDGKQYRGRLYPDARPSKFHYQTGVDDRASFWFYPDELRALVQDLGFLAIDWNVKDRGAHGVTLSAILKLPHSTAMPRITA